MPVWLSFMMALFGTAAFFGGLYGALTLLVSARRRKASPTIGVASGEAPNTLRLWAQWNAEAYAIEFYRIRVSHFSPVRRVKEGNFSITMDPPQKTSFVQPFELNEEFVDLLSEGDSFDSIITVELKTTDQRALSTTFRAPRLRKILAGGVKLPQIANVLKSASPDAAVVSTLDYAELVERKQKLKSLSDQAREKEKKAAAMAKPAPTPPPASGKDATTPPKPGEEVGAAATNPTKG